MVGMLRQTSAAKTAALLSASDPSRRRCMNMRRPVKASTLQGLKKNPRRHQQQLDYNLWPDGWNGRLGCAGDFLSG